MPQISQWGSPFTPDTLTQSQGRAQGRRRLESEIIARNGPAVVIDDDRQPGLSHGSIVAQQLDVELRVIDLPYRVRPESFAPVNQIEALAVYLVASVCQHHQPSWEGPYDSPNNRIARFAFFKRASAIASGRASSRCGRSSSRRCL